jgi:hypothetical protein
LEWLKRPEFCDDVMARYRGEIEKGGSETASTNVAPSDKLRQELKKPNRRIDDVYFLDTGIASFVSRMLVAIYLKQ